VVATNQAEQDLPVGHAYLRVEAQSESTAFFALYLYDSRGPMHFGESRGQPRESRQHNPLRNIDTTAVGQMELA
jgi:hypothetical protein